jgi:hypothetical protein
MKLAHNHELLGNGFVKNERERHRTKGMLGNGLVKNECK